jgi:predicted DNA-binding transcriptional regulator AlpA
MVRAEPQERLLRKKDVVKRLALSPRSVDRLVAGEQLTKVKLMGAVRFKESEVMALINGETT